ncbi:MAG: histidine phosphatase family protein [Eubacteriales bacterium]|nr:histidine phosphatase family protein [Eubacteriales bacterium]
MSIYLIRHGKTAANEQRRYCGSTDLPLSEKGREELRSLCYDIHPQSFLTSGMRRTDETLQILFGTVPFSVDTRFREVDFGDFEMKTYEELKDDPAYQDWLTGDNEANVPPHGESGVQMTRRVLEAFSELPDGTALITHGGVTAAIMAHLFPAEGKHRYQWQPQNGRGYEIDGGTYRPIP